MRLAKFVASFILLAIAWATLNRVVIVPWHVNVAKKSIERNTMGLITSGNARGAVSVILRNLEQLETFIDLTPQDVELYMLRGANLRLLNRTKDAIDTYSAALEYDQRPEIYFNLGLVLLEAGRESEAVDNLTVAVRFRSDYLKLIDNPGIRAIVAGKAAIAI